MLQLDNIFVSFNKGTPDELRLFENFNFSVNKSDFISVIGSNGSGKTTLLNLICGSINPDSGKILLHNEDVTNLSEHKRAKFIGRVFQDPKAGTCSSLTVLENFALADNKNKHYGLKKAVNKKRINDYREMLSSCDMGLEDRMNTPVGLLSGGQRQAIALVIAGMTDIDLLILDEHTAALDPKSSETVMELTKRLIIDRGITAIMVTHNLRFAAEYGNRIVMFHRGNITYDIAGEEKKNLQMGRLKEMFNEINN